MDLPYRSENLVIVRAGKRSLHAHWVESIGDMAFDLLVTAYEDGVPATAGPGIVSAQLPGWKVAGYAEVFRRWPEIFTRYKRVALLDDDLLADTRTINRMFAIGARFGLALWQPSLTWDSYFSYACVLQNIKFKLRYVNFVEMMCPFFTVDYLKKIAPLFSLGQETGIDLVWGRGLDAPWFKIAVIDEVAVKHTRPVGQLKHVQGFRPDERYDERMAEVLTTFKTSFRGPVGYAAIDRAGTLISSRAGIARQAIRTLGAWTETPMSKGIFLRLVLAFIRHAAVRPLNMDHLDLNVLNKGGPADTGTRDNLRIQKR